MPRRSFAVMLALMAVWFLVLSAGEFHPFAPAFGLAQLPLLSSFLVYGEYTIAFSLFAALALGAAGAHAARPLLGTPTRRIAFALVCAAAVGQLLIVNQRRLGDAALQPRIPGAAQIS